MKINIKITQDILRKAQMCGTNKTIIAENCAVALAVRELLPKAMVASSTWMAVEGDKLHCFTGVSIESEILKCKAIDMGLTIIDLPENASKFIKRFDRTIPSLRPFLAEFDFDIDLPESVIDSIGIEEVNKILSTSETLSIA